MTVYREIIHLNTSGQKDMSDITGEVVRIVKKSGIAEGLVNVFNTGSTGVVGTIEFEPGLKKDFPDILEKLIPPSKSWGHEMAWNDGNGHSHLQASMLGPEVTIPVAGGQLMTGTWQQIFHYEADIKPRVRKIVVTVLG